MATLSLTTHFTVDIPDDESDDASATVKEPRFAMNTIIGNQVSAYKLLQNMASVFYY